MKAPFCATGLGRDKSLLQRANRKGPRHETMCKDRKNTLELLVLGPLKTGGFLLGIWFLTVGGIQPGIFGTAVNH